MEGDVGNAAGLGGGEIGAAGVATIRQRSAVARRRSPASSAYGAARCTWRGLDHFKAYIWSVVVAHNLVLFARRKPV
jgi:hypothetical protein